MKTRIISGAVLIALLAGVLTAGSFFPFVITAVLAALCVAGVYELLRGAVGIKSRAALIAAGLYAALSVVVLSGYTVTLPGKIGNFTALTVLFSIAAAVLTLINHAQFETKHIVSLLTMPLVLSFAFSSLVNILHHSNGIYLFLLLLNFSSICDMGAYFTGTLLGKHKLCPAISPKKTVEGAIGGIVWSLLVTVVLCFGFSLSEKLPVTLILTVPFCVLGMIGDLFASAIKRAAGIKDYGNLIPGHGGVLDRVDSILMIAPAMALLVEAGVL